jgi:hypothetical protein
MCGIYGLCLDSFDEDAPGTSNKRGMGFGSVKARDILDTSPAEHHGALEKRDNMDVEFECVDSADSKGKKRKWRKKPWTSSGQRNPNNPIYDNALTHMFEDHCSMTNLRVFQLPDGEYFASKSTLTLSAC